MRADRPAALGIGAPDSRSSTLLEARDVSAGYGAVTVLRNVSIAGDGGEILFVLGDNGAGKSTLLRVLAGLIRIDSGQISLGGADVTRAGPESRAEAGLTFVRERAQLFAGLTISEHLALAARLAGRRGADWKERADFVLSRFPILSERMQHRAGTLSGGQRQLVALATALAGAPNVLLLDEPTAGLSDSAASAAMEATRDAMADGLVLVAEQDSRIAARWGTRVLPLKRGVLSPERG